MSIQKPSKNVNYLRQPKKPFEMIYREILDKLKNADALAVYCHLSGKPDNWEINDQYIMNHFGWGRDKARNAINCLILNQLMIRIQWIDEKGKFDGRNTDLLDGYNFKEYIEYDKKIHKNLVEYHERPNLSTENNPWPEKPSCGLSVDGKQTATIEDIKAFKKEEKLKREAAFYESTENQKLKAKENGVDLEKEVNSFMVKHSGKKTTGEFDNWLNMAIEYKNKKNNQSIRAERKHENITNSYAHLPDFTQQRLDREATEANSHDRQQGKNEERGHSRRNGMRQAKEYLFSENTLDQSA